VALEKLDGGGGAAAGTYKILLQKPDILQRGVNNVVDAVTVTVQEMEYGVVFSFTRSRSSWEGGAVQAAASFFAGNIQALAAYRHVLGIGYTQDTSASGNLIDQLVITVGTDDGDQESTFVWPLEQVDSQAVYAKVDSVFANVMAVANSTGG
jgi:uncharacterized protein YheU (UPF0270 family)